MLPVTVRHSFAASLTFVCVARSAASQSLFPTTDGRLITSLSTVSAVLTSSDKHASEWSLFAPTHLSARSTAAFVVPTVDVVSANPGANIERSACVSVAIRPNLAFECGDLRMSYTLPAIRYRNQSRAPVFLYNSQHAKPTPIVRAWVTLPAGSA